MNDIYKKVSNSILEYLKQKGRSASKEYLLIKIHYFNILGVLDKITIHKQISKGEKVISTIETIKTKKTTKQKTKQASSKKIDYTTRHTKLGLITKQEWNTLKKEYSKLLESKLSIISEYCESYKKLTKNTPFFIIDASIGGINIFRKNVISTKLGSLADKNDIDGYVLFGGCDFIKMQSEKLAELNNKEKEIKSLKIATDFSSVYQVFTTSKSVLKINDCSTETEFIRKYIKKSIINWKKIMLEYEGILVENNKDFNCNVGNKEKKINILNDLYLKNKGYIWRLEKTKFVKII